MEDLETYLLNFMKSNNSLVTLLLRVASALLVYSAVYYLDFSWMIAAVAAYLVFKMSGKSDV